MSAYFKDLFREIKKTPGRFISLIIITSLGAASVVGIQATSVDMRDVADKTYKEQNLYDLQIKSSVGFDEDDINALIGTSGVLVVMPTNIIDVFININNENRAVRTYALPDTLNTVKLLDGRLPANERECVVESSLLDDGNIKIGDSIKLSLDDMGGYFGIFTDDSFTVVGVVSSPLYISFQRGNTTLGDGSLRYYLYLHPNAYKLDIYTDVYVLMDGSHSMYNLMEDYYTAADGWRRDIEQVGVKRVQAKKDERADAQKKIDDGWTEYNDGLKKLNDETADARRELADAKKKLDDAKAELEREQKTLNMKIADGLQKINEQADELADGQKELDKQRAELEAGQKQINEAREQLEQILAELVLQAPYGVFPELDVFYEQAYAGLKQLDDKQAKINEGKMALSAAQKEIDDGLKRIDNAREDIEKERRQAQKEIDDGWVEYNKGLGEYNTGVKELETEETDALAELADAKRELTEAQEKLDHAPTPEWFAFTRKDGVVFDSYYQDTLRLEKIGYVFPIVFFLVAIMVSLTSMTRMVEDHRTQIGVYKALGYRPAAIMMKYLVYAFSASAIGGILGAVFGSWLFPLLITDAYSHIYNFPTVNTPIPMDIAAIAVLSAVLAVVLVTFLTYITSMSGSPALLMRPKPPANGKRIFLERVKIVWNRLGFFSKVTARNTFRYKRRFIMTLVGIAGCSALLLTAFGLRDSIGGVGELQYEAIIKYDARAYLKDITTDEQRDGLTGLLPDNHLYIREEAVMASTANGSLSAFLFVPETAGSLNDFINLYSPSTKNTIPMTAESVLITEKLSRVMGVGAGDSFTMTLGDGKVYTATITGVADNYLQHFVYMSPAVYSDIFGEELYANSVMIYYEKGREFSAPLLENENVRALIHNEEIKSQVGDQTDAMGIVTIVLIVLACALAFVVLFNLSVINISERTRELATLKVLGFYDNELSMYVFRENGIVVVLGILIGLVGGFFLHGFVLSTIEIDLLKFPQIIRPFSYIIAVVLSLAFSVFVSFIMSFKLARVDMVESLKNVE